MHTRLPHDDDDQLRGEPQRMLLCRLIAPRGPAFFFKRPISLPLVTVWSSCRPVTVFASPGVNKPSSNRSFATAVSNMNAQELSQYLTDAPPSVVRLEIEKHFEPLSDKQKRYAHFISK